MLSLAEQGLGLVYAFEPAVREQLESGRLVRVLEAYAPTVPGFFLYFPSRAEEASVASLKSARSKDLPEPWRRAIDCPIPPAPMMTTTSAALMDRSLGHPGVHST